MLRNRCKSLLRKSYTSQYFAAMDEHPARRRESKGLF